MAVTKVSASTFQEEEMRSFTASSEENLMPDSVLKTMDPVLTQPGLGITKTTVTTISQTGGEWSSGLLDVCGDKTTCNVKAVSAHDCVIK